MKSIKVRSHSITGLINMISNLVVNGTHTVVEQVIRGMCEGTGLRKNSRRLVHNTLKYVPFAR